MKKLLLSALFVSLAFGAVQAQSTYGRGHQQAGAHAQRGGRGTGQAASMKGRSNAANQRLYGELNLSPNQQAQADRLNQQLRSNIQALRSNNSLSQEQKKAQMMSLIQRNQYDFRSVLTYQQAQKYDAMVRDMQAQRAGKGQGRQRASGSNVYNNSQSLQSLSSGNLSLASVLGNNLSLSNTISNNFNISDILGSLSLDSILSILSGILI